MKKIILPYRRHRRAWHVDGLLQKGIVMAPQRRLPAKKLVRIGTSRDNQAWRQCQTVPIRRKAFRLLGLQALRSSRPTRTDHALQYEIGDALASWQQRMHG